MARIVRWRPLDDWDAWRNLVERTMDEVNRSAPWTPSRSNDAVLPIDMYETDEQFVIKARVPGVEPEDVDISITGDTLSIKAKLTSDAELDETCEWCWYNHELWHGNLSRVVTLPSQVNSDEIEATFKHGLLTLSIPKAEEVKPKTIKVNVA